AAFAAKLEQNIKNAVNVDSVACLSQMQGQINDSLHMLDTLFPDESAVLTTNTLDNNAILPIQSIEPDKINRLMELLVEQNLDAIEYLDRLLSDVVPDKQWLRLKNQVSQLEFLDAVDTLTSIIKE
ncbi:hypothetical protein CXF78_19570, partial [Shewanella sp. 11B5]